MHIQSVLVKRDSLNRCNLRNLRIFLLEDLGLAAGPRVHGQLKQVRDKIEKHDQSAIENDGSEDQRIVSIEDRFDKLLTETRYVKHFFYDERTRYQSSESGSQERDDWKQSTAQSVLENNLVSRNAFSLSGADKVLVKNIQHPPSGQSSDISGIK